MRLRSLDQSAKILVYPSLLFLHTVALLLRWKVNDALGLVRRLLDRDVEAIVYDFFDRLAEGRLL